MLLWASRELQTETNNPQQTTVVTDNKTLNTFVWGSEFELKPLIVLEVLTISILVK